jgi:phosphoribosylformimino-5-aminoimidazole carboxamide ribotide isomerase
MRIIPAIDIMNGKCVRLTQGKYESQKIYNHSPIEVAKQFEANGLKYLHVVDLDGAKSNAIINLKTLEALATETSLQIDFGGGIKSNDDIVNAFNAGVHQVTIGSTAVKNPTLTQHWLKEYGPHKIIIGADCLNNTIAINGWQEKSNLNIIEMLNDYVTHGAMYTVVTDIDKDGMLNGPSVDLYQTIKQQLHIHLIASGGISTLNDLLLLKNIGCEGAIIGKAIYEGNITLKQLSALC